MNGMAFYHDILRYNDPDTGQVELCELEYSIQDCIDNGWLDPKTGIWTRETVVAPDDDEYPFLPRPDPQHGVDQDLNLELRNGKWVHAETVGGRKIFLR